MDTLEQDFKLALRKLRKSPGFAFIAILTLALGMGANSAIFSVINTVLLDPLPMRQPDQLVRLYDTDRRTDKFPSSALNFRDIRAQATSFTDMMAVDSSDLSLTGVGGEPERLQGAEATASFFSVLGAQPALGRGFAPDEDLPGKSKVVVLGNAVWKRRFGGDAGIIGRSILVGGEPHTVVGVMPPGFDFPLNAQLWRPVTWEKSMVDPENRGAHFLSVYGRLKPGVSLQAADQEVKRIAKGLEQQYPKNNTGVGARLVSLREEVLGDVQPALLVLLAAVAAVLLIACANLSNLLLARAASREGEISVRLALGASRGRIVRQLLVESTVLALLGAALGLLLATWGLDALVALGPEELPRLQDVSIDSRVLAFTGVLALLTSGLFGLIPALQASRVELSRSLGEVGKGGSTGGPRQRARNALIVAETALAVVLLVAAGLLMKSFVRLQQVELGYRTDHVLAVDLSLPTTQYPEASPAVAQFYDQLLSRVRALPGVKSAGTSVHLPLSRRNMANIIQDLSRPEPEPGKGDITEVRLVSQGFVETLRVPLLRGRLLTDQDGTTEGNRAVLINEEAAKKYWPGEDPLGRTVKLSADWGKGLLGGVVVGIVGNTRFVTPTREPKPETYVPYAEAWANDMSLVVHTDGDPLALASAVRAEVRSLDKNLPVANVRTLDALMGAAVSQPRFFMLLVGVFAGLALLLASIGIYGVVTHAVSLRTRELGIRMALGADARQVVGMVLGQYLRVTGAGLALGVGLAYLASRLLDSMLYGVGGGDPLTYVGVALLLGTVALAASYLPASRATRIDPALALRQE
ncbi:ABC transporter permease [Aggregicoccus sp. 17bor-14]|uniref:ABC transporter permease n=1 Tax=Myxococcaceae TaxID=31 RepID=UPI00129D1391|nr:MULTISPECIES: ABC transporter permease [Myxococcaceae]MBF5043555.1 ABC transporter permease [Simulacricoccus sp. 17bor-14]MRI89315.1 ABC transporter permease [Aggregicoccus sp. 17bor-14]